MSDELTVKSALAELEQIETWLQNLTQMHQQQTQVSIRAGFLQGFLAGQAEAPAEEENPKPEVATTKRTTPKGSRPTP